MHYILFDKHCNKNFLPFTHTRSVATIRCGIYTFLEKWEHHIGKAVNVWCEPQLQYQHNFEIKAQNYFIAANIFPNAILLQEINNMASNSVLKSKNVIIAYCLNETAANSFITNTTILDLLEIEYSFEINSIDNLWDIFSKNDYAIREDYNVITEQKVTEKASNNNTIIGNKLFLAKGAKVNASIINTETGPVYIGEDAEVMEGCILRGPIALGKGAQLKMGAKIYGASTFGPGCKVGGEVNNAVFFANSSKAHDGFVGNAVIGEWCNIGADSNNSNLKNNYEEVKLWSEDKNTFVKTGLQFCGLIMADHSKCGINTMFNTGTVIGVSCNIFGSGFPRNYVPSFSWGGASGFTHYALPKALQTMRLVYARRGKDLCTNEEMLYTTIYNQAQNKN